MYEVTYSEPGKDWTNEFQFETLKDLLRLIEMIDESPKWYTITIQKHD